MRQDIDIHFTPHPLTGDLVIKKGPSAIKQSIRNIVLTSFYERGFNVTVGSNVRAHLFNNIDPLTVQTLREDITQAIANYEPDVEVLSLDIAEDGANTIEVRLIFLAFNDLTEHGLTIPLQRLG